MSDIPGNTRKKPRLTRRKMADPGALLRAAESAPKRFDIGGYFQALRIMREKGYSWRHLGEWVRGFNIEISHVHLRRLYVLENERQGRMAGQNAGGAAVAGKGQPERQPRTEPANESPVIAAVNPPVQFQQEDLQRYEGMSREETGPGFNVRND